MLNQGDPVFQIRLLRVDFLAHLRGAAVYVLDLYQGHSPAYYSLE